MQSVGDALQVWIIEYRKGMPKRLGDTNFALVSNLDNEHHIDSTNNLFPVLETAMYELGLEIKVHLNVLKNDLVKSKL